MPLEPKYAENIIVGVIFASNWNWYVSPPWLWILDLEQYDKHQGFGDRGLKLGTISYDRAITVVNKDTGSAFLDMMKQYEVSTDHLRKFVRDGVPIERLANATKEEAKQIFSSALKLFPSLEVDFDQQILRTAYAEQMHIRFEAHLPLGWQGYDNEVTRYVPEDYKYWMIDGVDYFSKFFSGILAK